MSVKLNNGVEMPLFGTGTTHNEGGIDVDSLELAFRCGVRLVDTAKRYGSERIIREALKAFREKNKVKKDVKKKKEKDDFFLTSKLWPGDVRGKGSVKRAFEKSCDALGVKTLDLYLVHWPGLSTFGENPDEARRNVWMEMEELYKSGHVRAIGVSNFETKHLRSIEKTWNVVPAVNQIEFNPFQNPKELREYCLNRDIHVEGYCPFGKGKVFHDRRLSDIAKRLNMPISHLIIHWHVQNHITCIPKSNDAKHIIENASYLSCGYHPLDSKTMNTLDSMHSNLRVTWDPTNVP
jgi:diketogulonate reductase-like aldo/keto reductase